LLKLNSCYLNPYTSAERRRKQPFEGKVGKKEATLKSQPELNLGLLLFVRGLKICWVPFTLTLLYLALCPVSCSPGKGTALDGSPRSGSLWIRFWQRLEDSGPG
jgi:hypothetical protein